MTRLRRLVFGLLVSLATIAVVALAAEGALRVAYSHSLDFGLEMWKYAVKMKRRVADPKLGFVHAPSTRAHLMGVDVHLNAQGFRGRELNAEKPPGTWRVLALGDSTTFGWGVAEGDTVAALIEAELDRAPPPSCARVEVVNAGVGNYDTVQEVESYKTRGRALKPDLIVLEYFINDAEPVPSEERGFLAEHSYLNAFVKSRTDGILRLAGSRPNWRQYYSALYDDDQPGWQAARAALVELAAMARTDGTKLVVAILPELHELEGEYPFVAAHAKVKAVLAQEGVPVIELLDGLRGHGPERELWVTPLDAHPNAKANRLVAAQLAAWMRAHP